MTIYLELKGKEYAAARVGVAVSENMPEKDRSLKVTPDDFAEWWTPQWRKAVEEGLFVRRDIKGGHITTFIG